MDDQELKAAVQLTVKETEPCVRELAATVPAAVVTTELDGQLRDAAKYARLPGFRPGKAPLAMVRNHFGKHAAAEAVRRMYGAVLMKAVEDEKLDIIGYPPPPESKVDLPPGADWTTTIKVSVAPDFELPEYKGLALAATAAEIDDAAVEAGVARYREMYAEFAPVTEPAAPGDMLKMSYDSGQAAPEGAAEHIGRFLAATDSWVWLSEPELLPGMIAGLTGVKAGESRTLKVAFPEDHREKDMAGRTLEYRVEVAEVHRRLPIADDAELCRRLNVADLGQVRDNVRRMLERESTGRHRNELRRQAVDKVCSPLREIPLPPALLAEEVEKEFRAIANRLVRSEADAEAFAKDQEKHLADARQVAADRLRQFFIFRRIAKAEGIQVGEHEVAERIRDLGRAYGIAEKDLQRRMADNGGIEELHIDLLMGKVTDFIVDHAAGATPEKDTASA